MSAAAIVILGLAWAMPPVDDFSLENPFWNGLSELNSRINPIAISDLSALPSLVPRPPNSTLLLLGPSERFTDGDVDAVRSFLEAGGLVVLAEDFGAGNDLLKALGVEARFSGMVLMDPLFKDKGPLMPRVVDFAASPYTRNISALTLNYATALIEVGDGVRVLARSTPFSYLAKGPGAEAELVGPFPVMAEVEYGRGSLVLISDSSIFINSMLDRDDNYALLRNLVDGRAVYVDVSHWAPSPLKRLKLLLSSVYDFASETEVRYGLAALLILVIFKAKRRGVDVEVDELEDVLREHPEWDRSLLERLKRLRDEHGAGGGGR